MWKRAKITTEVLLTIAVLLLFCGCTSSVTTIPQVQTYKSWALGPFIKQDLVNPILPAQNDGFRRRFLTTNIRCRNLGL